VARLVSKSTALARVKQQFHCWRQATTANSALNPRPGIGAFKAARSAQVDVRIEGADGNSDLRVGSGGQPLGCGNVGLRSSSCEGTPLELWAGQGRAARVEC